MVIEVTELNFYPIKSCAGTALDTADIALRGIRYDREWLIVDESTNNFITQREIAKLCLIKPEVSQSGDELTLNAPGMDAIKVPVTRSCGQRRVTVWSKACKSDDQGDAVGQWLSKFLNVDCRLVRMADDHKRQVDQRYAKRKTDQVGFADDFPILLISEESLVDLNSRLNEKIPMNRFRPNIVVKGCNAFDEDNWKTIKIGELLFDVVKPCARCTITTIDQSDANKGPEPLKTLAAYRNSRNRLLFGQNIVHHAPGKLRIGDTLEIID
ncbi:MAG: MOSC domain-containing protein [Candidatus Melainabacteria bacterium]|nr:MOSC domain-containing protein [Candidatus Melainabacteria bacterium]